jgi:3-polyprenyl-4-hydroxybenzoate decarboxylase
MTDTAVCFYLRDPNAVVVGHHNEVTVINSSGRVVCMRSIAIRALHQVLSSLRTVRSFEQVVEDTGLPPDQAQPILNALVEKGAALTGPLERVSAAIPTRLQPKQGFLCRNLVLGVSGTIQAALSISLAVTLGSLVAEEVEVVLTSSATRFLSPDVISYFGLRAWTDVFEPRGTFNVPHIALATNADVVLLAPASANTIHRLANGACSDLLSLVVAATKAPVVVVPAMNAAMLASPAINRNIDRLRADGLYVVEPGLAFEVSNTSDGQLGFCGVGVNERNVLAVLRTVLQRHTALNGSEEQSSSSLTTEPKANVVGSAFRVPSTNGKRQPDDPAQDGSRREFER